ncbi:Signal transduction histidine kinase [Pedococcus dokdonensis]|uniref:histidine kinase n=1 Tax=Pedococcus dokdonensis TaxID=443156 RepID=A0A1H0M229_9MICO|nr:histidine kinase [Pedococcus dokdonensis]SDO74341.1 Signal transduction histidine kinase [Pedococcus dokdonensis]
MTDVWGDERPSRRQVLLDVSVGLVLAALLGPLHATIGVAAGIAAALVGVALALRRLSWQAMSVVAIGAAVLQVASGQVAYLADPGYAVLFFTLGAHRSRGVRRWGLACAAVATVVAGTFMSFQPRPSATALTTVALSAGFAALTAVVAGGGWVAGFVRWQNRQGVQARVDAQLEAAERRRLSDLYDVEQERRRIAADMHDVVAHSWAVVAAQSDGARYGLSHDPAGAERALEVIGETARAAITDLRTIVAQLRDPALAPSTPGFAQQSEVIDRMRTSGMDLRVEEHGERDESPLVALTAHRLLAESLTNALKHGDLRAPVRVEQDWTDGYRLTVTNRLRDQPPGSAGGGAALPTGTGHGLVGMAERTTVAGGTFRAGPEGGSWVVRVQVPRNPVVAPSPTDDEPADAPRADGVDP